MIIELSGTGKRFNREWVFRNCSYQFVKGNSYAITGPNGSGKSTLLQVIGGAVSASEGKVDYLSEQKSIAPDEVYKMIGMVAPYLELIEEMTALEFLHFHKVFKPFAYGLEIKDILQILGLEKAATKQIRYYSSGMKQRIKLAQAIFTDNPILLLDEPCTNLDTNGYDLYYELMEKYTEGKLVIVSSNDINEYNFCKNRLSILDFKS